MGEILMGVKKDNKINGKNRNIIPSVGKNEKYLNEKINENYFPNLKKWDHYFFSTTVGIMYLIKFGFCDIHLHIS